MDQLIENKEGKKTLAQPVANCPQQAYRTKTNGSNSKNKITC